MEDTVSASSFQILVHIVATDAVEALYQCCADASAHSKRDRWARFLLLEWHCALETDITEKIAGCFAVRKYALNTQIQSANNTFVTCIHNNAILYIHIHTHTH